MKTLRKGDESKKPKWVGLVMVCPCCGQHDQLERPDEKLAKVSITETEVEMECPTCMNLYSVKLA